MVLPSRRTPAPTLASPLALGLVPALACLLALASCSAEDSPETAYSDFATAVNDGDETAYLAVTVDDEVSDLSGAHDFAGLVAAVDEGRLFLPESASDVDRTSGPDFMEHYHLGKEWLARVAKEAKVDDLRPQDVALFTVVGGFEGDDVHVMVMRADDRWRTWLIEPPMPAGPR